MSAVPCIAAREDTAPESLSAVESPASSCGKRADELIGVRGEIGDLDGRGFRSVGEETLWIFDADFEDLTGDNAGWTSLDRSGTLAVTNYWHKDTIHRWSQDPAHPLGDSTWWCGTYGNSCWRQPRGYANNWICMLSRSFPEIADTEPGDAIRLEYDQRYAMENHYDYGYTDVSTDGGESWTTVRLVSNWGFAGTPGMPVDWDGTNPGGPGHMVVDLSEYAGQELDIRFRFESDAAYSSQDQFDNPGFHSVQDGAWQLDNIAIHINDALHWIDDCESPGDNGWLHDSLPASGQTGVVFERVYDPDPLRVCAIPPGHWWMAALDPETGRMVDGQNSWLISPPIDISGAEGLVGYWEMWVDCPSPTEDVYNLYLANEDEVGCVTNLIAFVDESPGVWHGGPAWGTQFDNWDSFADEDWLAVGWHLYNDAPPSEPHMTGFMLDRQRVGVSIGGQPTIWDYSIWDRFHDTFVLSDALSDSATIVINDGDGIASARMLVSSDGGQTWDEHAIILRDPESGTWIVPPPTAHIAEHAEVRYYFEATDGVGNVRRHPKTAPQAYYEFSVLPIHGSVTEPCILLVDKHGRLTHSEDRHATRMSESFYREALDILGFEYDVFDVNVPSGSILSEGPDSAGMKYYDTQIWFTNEFSAYTLRTSDQFNLIGWLAQSAEGKERNLFLTGNDIGKDLMEFSSDTLSFYTTWLASEYVQNDPGDAFPDTMPILQDATGDFDFMTYDDRFCHLWSDSWYSPNYYDVVQPGPAAEGAELVAEYVIEDMTVWPAGVAYTHPTMGYQTVNLGFGVEFMIGDLLPNGHYTTGAYDRVDLMANIMEYFGKEPTGPGTGAEDDGLFVTRLGHARPNPFNPKTTIAYSLAGRSRVTIRVYDLAGRVVRTLVDDEREPGEYAALWDGTTDSGKHAASGVYFIGMEGTGDGGSFSRTGKAVMLK
jgi:hypothetical protein